MKKVLWLAWLVSLSCAQQKPTESAATDSVPQDSLITAVFPYSSSVTPTADPESELDFATIVVEKNTVLEELTGYPFSMELDAMKTKLDSLGVSSQYENGENGGLSYDSAEISFNRSYGESICTADIRSGLIALKKNITIGMSLTDFLTRTGVRSSEATNLRYEYAHSARSITINCGLILLIKHLPNSTTKRIRV
jgi:hypothetical protein